MLSLRIGRCIVSAVLVGVAGPGLHAQDLPHEWADFAPRDVPAERKGPMPAVEWARKTQAATALSPVEPTSAEQAWLADAREGRWEAVAKAFKAGGLNPNTRDETGASVLVWAARAGQDELVRDLLKRGADPDVRGESGFTALGAAAYAGQLFSVRALLKAGADPTRYGASGYAPVHLAAMTGQVKVLDELRRAGADLRQEARSREQVLGVAAANGQVDTLQWLQQVAGLSLAETDGRGLNALHAAAAGQQLETVRWLAERGVRAPNALTEVLIAQLKQAADADATAPDPRK